MPSFRVRQVVLDCADPRALAGFYRALLGWAYHPGHERTDPEGDEWLVLEDADGTRLAFQRSDRHPTPWREDARVHLDLTVDDLGAAHAHALRCGARALTGTPEEEGHPQDPFRVYADPFGHLFCLVEDRPRPSGVGPDGPADHPAG